MKIHTDLHAHSAFAGGARAGGKTPEERRKRIKKRFHDSAIYSPLKGVNILGTGDAQYSEWLKFLKDEMNEEDGIFSYRKIDQIPESPIIPDENFYQLPRYILQSEYIFTGPIPNSDYKKRVHVLVLFPDFTAIEELLELFDQWEVSYENMARPFITCDTTEEVAQRIHAIASIHPLVEIIPAHVMTPQGIYGGNRRVNRMDGFIGDSVERINAIETGLSADPYILGTIPELDNMTLISNADAHSAKLHRIGREFTTIEIDKLSYKSIIEAIRSNNIVKTAEFHPTEGRYFLTGHRGGRDRPGNHEKNEHCFFSPKYVPDNDICPQCNKELTIGVLQRTFEISNAQGGDRKLGDGPERDYVTMIPLVEIIAHALEMKTLTSKTVQRMYSRVISIVGTEIDIWLHDNSIQKLEQSDIPTDVIEEIKQVKRGNFSFFPGGYDGKYGELRIGEKLDYLEVKEINH